MPYYVNFNSKFTSQQHILQQKAAARLQVWKTMQSRKNWSSIEFRLNVTKHNCMTWTCRLLPTMSIIYVYNVRFENKAEIWGLKLSFQVRQLPQLLYSLQNAL